MSAAMHRPQSCGELLLISSCCARSKARMGSTARKTQVGFIQKLPTQLVAAFRATLEEIGEASLLLHVVDVSSPNAAAQTDTVCSILEELGIHLPIVTVWNKATPPPSPAAPGAILISGTPGAFRALKGGGVSGSTASTNRSVDEPTASALRHKTPCRESIPARAQQSARAPINHWQRSRSAVPIPAGGRDVDCCVGVSSFTDHKASWRAGGGVHSWRQVVASIAGGQVAASIAAWEGRPALMTRPGGGGRCGGGRGGRGRGAGGGGRWTCARTPSS